MASSTLARTCLPRSLNFCASGLIEVIALGVRSTPKIGDLIVEIAPQRLERLAGVLQRRLHAGVLLLVLVESLLSLLTQFVRSASPS
jgi:hypothetical protein